MLLTKSDWKSLLQSVSRPGDDSTYLLAGGFQRIKSPTVIPMRKLVLLYGPNSAGKSTVLDILSMLNSLWVDGIEGKTASLVSRWRRNDGDLPLSVGFSMLISQRAWLTSIGAKKWVPVVITDKGFTPGSSEMDSAERRITWIAKWEGAASEAADTTVRFDVFVGESLLASFRHDPDTDKPTIKIMNVPFEGLLGSLGSYISDPEGEYEGNIPENPDLQCDYLKPFSSYIPGRQRSEIDELIRLIFAVPLFIYAGDMIAEPSSYLGPLRWIPRSHELRFLEIPPERVEDLNFDFFKPAEDVAITSKQVCSLFDRPSDGRFEWRILAANFAFDSDASRPGYTEEDENSFVDEASQADIVGTSCVDEMQKSEESLIDQINRWLAHEEFLGTSYRISANLSRIVSVASSKESAPSGSNKAQSEVGNHIVTFELVDEADRTFEFRDVGTGFSQVLPVLICCAVHKNITILEQPELHLHPRLQAKLLDLLLESINKSRSSIAYSGDNTCRYDDALLLADRRKCLVVESHSEHIVLRLMRRIHESSAADIKHKRLHVKPSDVAVIYFEPEGDETYVHILELTNDGDFADRWPQGFFDERYQEMFDE